MYPRFITSSLPSDTKILKKNFLHRLSSANGRTTLTRAAGMSSLLVQSARLAAGVAARRPATLLLPGTLAVLVAELGAHVGGLGRQATPRLH